MTLPTRRVAIVSPYFPPSTLAGVHRARFLARHLPSAGWEPVVLCVHERHHEERLDPGLTALLPENLRIIKVDALPWRVMRRLGIGDLSLRAYWQLRHAIEHLLRTEKIDCMLITAAPYYSTLLARVVKRDFNLPVVLDFQDPWVSNWGASLPVFSKGGLSYRLATWLEPGAVRAADHVVSVSEGQNREMLDRYSWLERERLSALPIGGDPTDFDYLRDHPLLHTETSLPTDAINLSFVGTVMPRTGPVLAAVLAAVAQLRVEQPALAARLRLNFVGTSNQPNGHGKYLVRPYAEAAGVADIVFETPQRIPYLEAISLLANSTGILLLGSDEPHYTASKIYPALLSGRPSLGVFHRDSSAARVLRECGGAAVVDFSGISDLMAKTPLLTAGLVQLAKGGDSWPRLSQEAIAPYTAVFIAAQFGSIFDDICSKSRHIRP